MDDVDEVVLEVLEVVLDDDDVEDELDIELDDEDVALVLELEEVDELELDDHSTIIPAFVNFSGLSYFHSTIIPAFVMYGSGGTDEELDVVVELEELDVDVVDDVEDVDEVVEEDVDDEDVLLVELPSSNNNLSPVSRRRYEVPVSSKRASVILALYG